MIKVILSTDGKHTVWVEIPDGQDSEEVVNNTYNAAKKLYDKIIVDLGSKVKMWGPVTNGNNHNTPTNCPKCGSPMEKRKGRNGGFFWGCSNFPNCRATIDIPN